MESALHSVQTSLQNTIFILLLCSSGWRESINNTQMIQVVFANTKNVVFLMSCSLAQYNHMITHIKRVSKSRKVLTFSCILACLGTAGRRLRTADSLCLILRCLKWWGRLPGQHFQGLGVREPRAGQTNHDQRFQEGVFGRGISENERR